MLKVYHRLFSSSQMAFMIGNEKFILISSILFPNPNLQVFDSSILRVIFEKLKIKAI